jgi:hypothetical protein
MQMRRRRHTADNGAYRHHMLALVPWQHRDALPDAPLVRCWLPQAQLAERH